MTEEFIKRKHHPDSIKYDLPELEPILKETKGLIVYQEQVMMIATELAGFSLAEADLLRKAIGKKKTSVMKAQRDRFIQGAKRKGINPAKANQLFETINYFAGYGFNKSHSAAYAYLAFQTAYLKAHYPVCFLAALLTSEAEKGATDQVVKYINECKEMGIKVLPPDINESDLTFSVAKGSIRFGLAAIKNVGEQAVRSIIIFLADSGWSGHARFICFQPASIIPYCLSSLLNKGNQIRMIGAQILCQSLIPAGFVVNIMKSD